MRNPSTSYYAADRDYALSTSLIDSLAILQSGEANAEFTAAGIEIKLDLSKFMARAKRSGIEVLVKQSESFANKFASSAESVGSFWLG